MREDWCCAQCGQSIWIEACECAIPLATRRLVQRAKRGGRPYPAYCGARNADREKIDMSVLPGRRANS